MIQFSLAAATIVLPKGKEHQQQAAFPSACQLSCNRQDHVLGPQVIG